MGPVPEEIPGAGKGQHKSSLETWVKNAGKWNGLGQAPAFQELSELLNLLRAAGEESVPSAASPVLVTFSPLLHRKKFPHFIWMVLLPKKPNFFSYLELELFLSWRLLYLFGRSILSDFSVGFGSLMSIFWWTPSPAVGVFFCFFYPLYEPLKWFDNSVHLSVCDFWMKFMMGGIGAN